MATLTFRTFTGAGISTMFESLAKLRIAVFRSYPYLYEGSPDYEMQYLSTYARSACSLLFSVFDGDEMVGATTCIPLADETEEVQTPFHHTNFDTNTIFYFGESILLPPYRGKGLGHRFFDEREAHARSFGTYRFSCFCAVVRPANHPARPADYRPLDEFWKKRGYQPLPHLQSHFEWTDIGQSASTPKSMTYWMKEI